MIFVVKSYNHRALLYFKKIDLIYINQQVKILGRRRIPLIGTSIPIIGEITTFMLISAIIFETQLT